MQQMTAFGIATAAIGRPQLGVQLSPPLPSTRIWAIFRSGGGDTNG
jgi:hypothetical protein